MLNSVNIQGRLTNDPQLNQNSKNDMASFTLACQRNFKNKQGEYDADFIRCVAFGKSADFVMDYFHKGDQMLVSGEWRTGSYEDKDGNRIYTNDLNISQMNFCGSSKQSDQNDQNNIDLSSLPFKDEAAQPKVDNVPF